MVCGFKSPDDILFKNDFKLWKDKINTILTVDNGNKNYNGKVGLITEYIKNIEIENIEEANVIVVGPPMMLKFSLQEFLRKGIKEENIWVSYERKMCCGIEKCGHYKIDDTYVCLDGPVFNYTKAMKLVD